jgi:4-coumarate--CoA ligase
MSRYPAKLYCSNGQEHPRAFVVRRNEDIKAEEIAGWVKQRLSPHKWLTGGVYFVDSIPRTPSGKVKKRDLPEVESQRVSKL